MSIESMVLALHHSKAVGTDKVVLLGIANHDGDGGSWPSVDTLATYANVSRRAVQNSIAKLIAAGEIEVHINDGGTQHTDPRYRPNRYEIMLTCPLDCDGSRNHRTGVYGASPLKRQGVKSATARDEAEYQSGVKPTSPEPSIEPSENPRPTDESLFGEIELDPKAAARAAADGFWERVKADTGKAPVGIKWMALAKLIEPFLRAGYTVPEVKKAVWAVYTERRPWQLAVIEQHLDGRITSGARVGKQLDALQAAIAAEECRRGGA